MRRKKPKTIAENSRTYYSRHRERVLEGTKHTARKRKYGLSPEGYEALYQSQNGQCAICEKEIDRDSKNTHIDHDHVTGVSRGILCRHCNLGIGHLKDNVEVLYKAINYLNKFI